MIRKIAMAMVMLAVVAVPAAAQTPITQKNLKVTFLPAAPAPAKKVDFTRVAPAVTTAPAPAPQSTGKKNFWKTPWPYVIVVGAAALVVVAVKSGAAGGY